MHENDSLIDELSLKASQHHIPELKAPEWSMIKDRLDKEMPEKEKRKRRFIFWPLLTASILLVGTSVYILTTGRSSKKDVKESTATESTATAGKPNTQSAETSFENKINSTTQNETTFVSNENKTPQEQEYQSPQNNTSQTASFETPNTFVPNLNASDNYSQKESIPTSKNRSRKIKQSTNDVSKKADNGNFSPLEEKETIVDEPMTSSTEATAKSDDETPSLPVTASVDSTQSKKTNQNIPDKPAVVSKTETPKPPKKMKCEVGLSYGADLSTIKYKYTEPISHSYGATLAYYISKRWSIKSGFYVTKKNYKAAGEDYQYKSSDYVPPGITTKLIEAIGICSMQEIPLSVRYHFPKSKLGISSYVSVGLSTYLMQKQEYDYKLQYNNYPATFKQKTYLENENYFLGVADISFGIRKRVNKHFNLELQPFAKLPLKGIGAGLIKINSIGSYLNLTYSF